MRQSPIAALTAEMQAPLHRGCRKGRKGPSSSAGGSSELLLRSKLAVAVKQLTGPCVIGSSSAINGLFILRVVYYGYCISRWVLNLPLNV